MSEPTRFLRSFARALATTLLYADGHPARMRALDASFELLLELQAHSPGVQFSFLADEVLYGQEPLREMQGWELGSRLADAGIQRLEFSATVSREEYDGLLEQVMGRLGLTAVDTAEMRQLRQSGVRFGAIGLGGLGGEVIEEHVPGAAAAFTLHEEIEAVRWMHGQVEEGSELPLIEADAVVRSLSVAMQGDSHIVLPLLQLKEFDQYTTTHSINVAVLAMGLAGALGLNPRDVRAFGVAALLHDLGKVRIPREILIKPGKLTEAERAVIQRHPAEGARIILESQQRLELAAAVAYEHHIMLNGAGYPCMHFQRECHYASKLVHVCDVYDALRTKRPYREAWESERALRYLEERAGTEFDPELAFAFASMMRQRDQQVVEVHHEETPVQVGA